MSTCNISLEDLGRPNPCANNMSGVNAIFLTLKKDVAKINATAQSVINTLADRVTIGSATMNAKAIESKAGKGFVSIFSAKDMGELKYATQGTISGCKSQKATLEIFHPGMKKQLLGFIATVMNEEMIVVVRLNNDEYHLLGNEHHGVEIADGTEVTSGKAVTDNNGSTITFNFDTPVPQVFYDGWDPYNETTGLTFIEKNGQDNNQGGQENGGNGSTPGSGSGDLEG